MNGLILSLLAAGCTSLSSLFFRKNTDNSVPDRGVSGYLVFFYLFSLILALLFNPDIWKSSPNLLIVGIGVCVGLLASTLMLLTAEALKFGPAGLTFAFQNASAIFPGLILFLCLGSEFGYSCSYLQMAGMAIVLAGLFLGAKNDANQSSKPSPKWIKYALACFVIQIFVLTFIQARCILFHCEGSIRITEMDDMWFMPGQFGSAFAMQLFIFLKREKKIRKSEFLFGSLGGIANFSSTTLLLVATKIALPLEKGILFPCFAVGSLILCNIWASRLYKENFNFKTNLLCSFGILMGIPLA